MQCTTRWPFPLRHRGCCSHKEINIPQWLSLTWRIGCKALAKFTKGAETIHDFCWTSAAEPLRVRRSWQMWGSWAEASIKHEHPMPTQAVPRNWSSAHLVPVMSDMSTCDVHDSFLVFPFFFIKIFIHSLFYVIPLASLPPSTWLISLGFTGSGEQHKPLDQSLTKQN